MPCSQVGLGPKSSHLKLPIIQQLLIKCCLFFIVGAVDEEDLGYVEEEYTLYCHICDQRFSSRHNRKEHLAGKIHLKNLGVELEKQQIASDNLNNAECTGEQANSTSPLTSTGHKPTIETGKSAAECCNHCVNRVIDISVDVSLDITNHMESFMYKHSQRELELQMLRENVGRLKEMNSQLSKDLITVQVGWRILSD